MCTEACLDVHSFGLCRVNPYLSAQRLLLHSSLACQPALSGKDPSIVTLAQPLPLQGTGASCMPVMRCCKEKCTCTANLGPMR